MNGHICSTCSEQLKFYDVLLEVLQYVNKRHKSAQMTAANCTDREDIQRTVSLPASLTPAFCCVVFPLSLNIFQQYSRNRALLTGYFAWLFSTRWLRCMFWPPWCPDWVLQWLALLPHNKILDLNILAVGFLSWAKDMQMKLISSYVYRGVNSCLSLWIHW